MNVSLMICTFGIGDWYMRGRNALARTPGEGAAEAFTHHIWDGSLAESRNDAARQATGDWLCFLDADDTHRDGFLAALPPSPSPRQVLVPKVAYVLPDGQPDSQVTFPSGGGSRPLIEINWIVVGALVHRDLFFEVGGFRPQDQPYEDWSLWLRCAIAGATFVKTEAVYEAARRTGSYGSFGGQQAYRRIRAEFQADYAKACP